MKKLHIALILLMITALIAGCGSDGIGNTAKNSNVEMDNYSLSDEISDTAVTDRKIIETFRMNVETKDFDSFMQALENEIASLGGYTESSASHNNTYRDSFLRSAELTVRVPKDKCSGFTDFIAKESNVTFKEMNTEDITLDYVDTESRISALTAQKESLEALLASAGSIADIIAVREELTNVIYQLESYQAKLRTLDNQVDYSTVTLSINEVERTTAVEKQSVWQEIGKNLSDNFADVWQGCKGFFVFAVSSLPYLLVLAVIGAIIALIIISSNRRHRKRMADRDRNANKQ